MIILKKEVFNALDVPSKEGLQVALQQAIQLEHATIPPYLYAFYSIKPGFNGDIGDTILQIVLEEMLHMALACNILNAIGGTPSIDIPGIIPTYPGPLPGAVEDGLQVSLTPLSLSLVRDTFMIIEQPEKPINFATISAAPTTIGRFYQTIKAHIQQLGSQTGSDLFEDPNDQKGRQVISKHSDFSDLIKVVDVATAVQAIETIVDQGEGTDTSPQIKNGQPELAHYYRFEEISRGKKLQPNPSGQDFSFSGPLIALDETGILPLPINPKASDYLVGSQERIACDAFNQAYTDLLHALHKTFNGQPNTLSATFGMMKDLSDLAANLFAIKLQNGKMAGPSFEFMPD